MAMSPVTNRSAYFFPVSDIYRDSSDRSIEVNEMFVVHLDLGRVFKNSLGQGSRGRLGLWGLGRVEPKYWVSALEQLPWESK